MSLLERSLRLIGVCLLLGSVPSARAVAKPDAEALSLVSLAHPVLEDRAQVERRIERCRQLVAQDTASGEDGDRTRSTLARYFLWFADETQGGGKTHVLDLRDWESPSVRRLASQIGLPPPRGWVWVREYTDVAVMPAPIRAAFQRQAGTRAVTFLSRYVAVLNEGDGMTPRSLQQDRIRQTLEHELVHVVLNSHLGIQAGDLPLWFHEGCAVTFSGQPGSQTVGFLSEGPTGLQWIHQQWNLSGTYREYQHVFRYLRHRLGEEDFHQQIRLAIMTASVSALLSAVDAADYAALRKQAEQWRRRRENGLWALACLALAGTGFIYWRRLPRTRKPAAEVV